MCRRSIRRPTRRFAFFVAIDCDGQWVGMSNLERQLEDPTFVWQGLTGVRREARGRGIAIALKLRTVSYAQRMGVDHIKTWNDQKNRPDARHQRGHGLRETARLDRVRAQTATVCTLPGGTKKARRLH